MQQQFCSTSHHLTSTTTASWDLLRQPVARVLAQICGLTPRHLRTVPAIMRRQCRRISLDIARYRRISLDIARYCGHCSISQYAPICSLDMLKVRRVHKSIEFATPIEIQKEHFRLLRVSHISRTNRLDPAMVRTSTSIAHGKISMVAFTRQLP